MPFEIKKIYEPVSHGDGMRILINRIWPRGISRFDDKIAVWLKEVAPTTELRHWFGHKPERWTKFRRRCRAELAHNAAVAELKKFGRGNHVTLLYAARDTEHNHALVLASYLARKPRRPKTSRR